MGQPQKKTQAEVHEHEEKLLFSPRSKDLQMVFHEPFELIKKVARKAKRKRERTMGFLLQ